VVEPLSAYRNCRLIFWGDIKGTKGRKRKKRSRRLRQPSWEEQRSKMREQRHKKRQKELQFLQRTKHQRVVMPIWSCMSSQKMYNSLMRDLVLVRWLPGVVEAQTLPTRRRLPKTNRSSWKT
jgi:hypothetical protein